MIFMCIVQISVHWADVILYDVRYKDTRWCTTTENSLHSPTRGYMQIIATERTSSQVQEDHSKATLCANSPRVRTISPTIKTTSWFSICLN